MKCSMLLLPVLIICMVVPSRAMESKTIVHLSMLPVIEGLGIYSSVKMVADGNNGSRAAGITNISILALNAGLGAFTAFGKPAAYSKFRRIHRIIGFTAVGAGLWLTIVAATDSKVDSHVPYTAGGYTAMAAIPVIVFSF